MFAQDGSTPLIVPRVVLEVPMNTLLTKPADIVAAITTHWETQQYDGLVRSKALQYILCTLWHQYSFR